MTLAMHELRWQLCHEVSALTYIQIWLEKAGPAVRRKRMNVLEKYYVDIVLDITMFLILLLLML